MAKIKKETPYAMFFNTKNDPNLKDDLTQFAFEDDDSLAKLVRKVMRSYRDKRKLESQIMFKRTGK